MLIKKLIEFGLSEKEAGIYLALLELEVAGVNEISKVAKINRSSAYVVLESLKKQGLVSISDDKNVRRYVATSPDILMHAADNLAKKQELVRDNIERIIPELKSLYKGTKKRPIVKVFEGKSGLISTFEDTLNSKEKLMRVISSPGNLGGIIGNYLSEYIGKRFKMGIKMKGIHPDDEIHRRIKDESPKNFDSSTLIPKDKYKFPVDLAIYDNKIGYMSGEDGGIALIIESTEMAEMMKKMFDLAFEEAKHLGKKPKK